MNSKKSQNTLFKPIRSKTSLKIVSAGRFLAHRTFNWINRAFVVQIIFIAAVAGIIFLVERFSDKEAPAITDGLGNEAALSIDFNDMQRMFTGEVIDGMTVLDTLNASFAAGKIKLAYYVDSNNNTKVKEINDHEADEDVQFAFYVNSYKIDSSKLNKIQIHPGDKITIKLE